MALTASEVISDIPALLELIQKAEAAIRALPQDASDLRCATSVIRVVAPGLCDLLDTIEDQAKSV